MDAMFRDVTLVSFYWNYWPCALDFNQLWILLIGILETNLSEILTEMQTISFKKLYLKISSVIWWPFCLVRNKW